MARYTGPVCKLCRREGVKLFLKGERCYSDKCAVDKRKSAPGQHGARRTKLSDYGIQLREKQKMKRIFGMLERQFRTFFERATHKKGKTGEILLKSLEMRLDSVALKMGLAASRSAARQLIRHNHVLLNNHKCNIPSCVVKVGDKISLHSGSRSIPAVALSLESLKREGHGVPTWMNWNPQGFEAEILRVPDREDIQLPVKEQLVVELYSK